MNGLIPEDSLLRAFTRREFLCASAGAAVVSALPGGPAPELMAAGRARPAQESLDITNFGARSGDGSDTTPAVIRALRQRNGPNGKRIVFPAGTYDFWPDRATDEYLYVSNNDPGMKKVAFSLEDMAEVEVDGMGSQFFFHGGVNPFVIERSRNVVLKNFSIDWKRPFHNEAKILDIGKDGIDLEIAQDCPYRVANGVLYFLGEDKLGCGIRGRDPCAVGGLLEFDSEKHETAYKVRDFYRTPYIPASVIGTGRVRIVEPGFKATPGNTLVFGSTNRDYPAFTITDSSKVKLANVKIHHCGGMGVIAQRSGDIELDHVQVTPSGSRVVSLPADATHFVNCTGRIEMNHCLFENQLDDATNVHGIYLQVSRKLSAKVLEGRLVHPAQRGFEFVRPGMRLELVHGDDLVTYAEVVAATATRTNDEYVEVGLAGAIPEECRVGDVFASVETKPDVTIRSCTIQKNRARGLLLGSRGKIVVEDCTFHTPGAAILMEGDGRYWFEQAGVRDLTIRRNRFVNCNYGTWGKATIEVGAGIDAAKRAGSRYNRNILVEQNEFLRFDQSPVVSVYSVDGLTVRGNRVEQTTAYPGFVPSGKLFDITDSVNVSLQPS
jgi:hypothetical protein